MVLVMKFMTKTDSLNLKRIEDLTQAGLYNELKRLFHNGGSLSIEHDDKRTITLFSVGSQHVTADNLDTAIRKAIIEEEFRREVGPFPNLAQRERWMTEHNVPVYLQEQ
jgi:hypothetical protein